ncbi:hypothetical protein ACTWQB_11325 [Piscibacillus sp. B03]|uniref:hypothetical protein n=1 Tax=Piscibacillus sp. B03 TaxID=3457430 RepID=UPI003FCEE21C
MSKNILVGLVVILIISNVYFIYKSSVIQNQANDMNRTINQNIRSEFTSLNTSLHNTANIIEQHGESHEKERYLSSLEREAHNLNEIKANIYNSLNLKDSRNAYAIHQQLFIVEKFIKDLAEGKISNDVKLNTLTTTIKRKQKEIEELFYSEDAFEIEAISHKDNIERTIDLLTAITNEINNVRDVSNG